jgi:uncharacterized protein YjbI with pentapeptide repeats
MCNHVYVVSVQKKSRHAGNRCPYPRFYARATTAPAATGASETPVLPMDSQGTCIFHSQDIDWKRKNGFGRNFRQLVHLLAEVEQEHDFAEFVFVGDEVTTKGGSEVQVLHIRDTVFRRAADFTGSSFSDSVEFDAVHFQRGATFKGATFYRDLKISNTRSADFDFVRAEIRGLAFFREVDCTGVALFDDARFTGSSDGFVSRFDGVQFQGLTTFAGASFRLGDESSAGFLNVSFTDVADFTDVQFHCHVDFSNVTFASAAEFIDTSFHAVGSSARHRGAAVEFKQISVAEQGVLAFVSTDPHNKMFNHDVTLRLKEGSEGTVRFENVNFNRIAGRDREQLTRLARSGRVEIGPGCIKYRFQTGVRTVFVEPGNAPLILEICQTFTNYFAASSGLNLGFEVVERDGSKISFFYFTDEDISEVMFLERLACTERHLWNLLSTDPCACACSGGPAWGGSIECRGIVSAVAPRPESDAREEISPRCEESAVINAVDAISALLGTFFRVGARIAVGAWKPDDTRALLNAVRFNDHGAEQRALSLHQAIVEKYTGQTLFGFSRGQNQLLVPMAPRSAPCPGPDIIKILFLGANSLRSPLDLEVEVKKIKDNLKQGRERENLAFEQEGAVTIDSLMQAMLDQAPTIVHFAGHGEQSGIFLRDELGEPRLVSADALSNLFRLFKDTVRCVVLNACYSEPQARAIRLHIPYVIGMRAQIQDCAAAAFSAGFYMAIAAGRDVPFAFDMGQARIKLEGVEGANIPVLI